MSESFYVGIEKMPGLVGKVMQYGMFARTIFAQSFKKIGRNLAYTLSDGYQAIRDHFIVIDQSAIHLYWHKYTLSTDKYQRMNLFGPQISFNDWLLLYSSFEDLIIDESVLDKRIT